MAFFGDSPSKAYEQQSNRAREYLGGSLRSLETPAIQSAFAGLQGIAAPTINALIQGQTLGADVASQSQAAQLGRMGLGNLAPVLGQGLRAGGVFQGNQLRARIFQDLLSEALGLQQAKSHAQLTYGMGLLGGAGQVALAQSQQMSPFQQILQAGATGASAAGALGLGGGSGQQNVYQ